MGQYFEKYSIYRLYETIYNDHRSYYRFLKEALFIILIHIGLYMGALQEVIYRKRYMLEDIGPYNGGSCTCDLSKTLNDHEGYLAVQRLSKSK